MSYELKLKEPEDTKIIEEDQIVEDDNNTVILNRPMNNTSNVVVRINDFRRDSNHQTEVSIREEATDQFNGNTDTIFVKQGPIYDGLKIGNLATSFLDVIVRITVEDEDVSGQLTGTEDYFYLEGRPILKDNNYDFSSNVSKEDVLIKKNGSDLDPNLDVVDVNGTSGRIQLTDAPLSTDTVTVTYRFRAKIKELDSQNSKIVLKEKPKTGQDVRVQYFSRVNDGWDTEISQRSLIPGARDVVFSEHKNTNRILVTSENVTSQFTGTQTTFITTNTPLLPLYQNFGTTTQETLNNAVVVTVNGNRAMVRSINAETGKIGLNFTPQVSDIVLVSYWYESDQEPDRISVDYWVDEDYSLKHSRHPDLADYTLSRLGKYITIENEDKLIQDLKKIIITTRGSDPVATWYGTTFETLIGTSQFPEHVITRISGEIIEALNRLKNAQVQQEEYQEVTDREFLDYIQNIDVEQDLTDSTFYQTVVDIVTQAGTAGQIEEPISLDEST